MNAWKIPRKITPQKLEVRNRQVSYMLRIFLNIQAPTEFNEGTISQLVRFYKKKQLGVFG